MTFRNFAVCGALAGLFGACSGDIGRDPSGAKGDETPPNAGGSAGRGTSSSNGGSGTGGASGGKGGTGVANPGGAGGTGPVGVASAGPLPFRRLTIAELNNTLRSLLGDMSSPASTLPSDSVGDSGFNSGNQISTVDADALVNMADTVATSATANFDALLNCDVVKMTEAGCAGQFVSQFGRRAFRRPLDASEVSRFQAFYDNARSQLALDFKSAIGLVVQAMLQSPNFLYHWEVAPAGGKKEGSLVKLGPYELAARLSYFLWENMPDDALAASADGGKLVTASDVEREARRMLTDGQAKKASLDFHQQWLNLAKLEELQKGANFPSQTAADEVAAFVDYAVYGAGGGKLTTLLTAPVAFANATSAKLYGVTGVTGTALTKIDLDPAQRAGILTQLGFLGVNAKGSDSEPIYRGVSILERLLCEQRPPPVANLPPQVAPTADVSTRQRHIEHENDPTCAGCHRVFEPLGFAFENYDGFGRFRANDGGKPVDATGTVTTIRGQETFTFTNGVALARELAASPQVQACAATKAFRFATGRQDIPDDSDAMSGIVGAFKMANLDLRELLVAVATSRSFLYRAPGAGEVLQ